VRPRSDAPEAGAPSSVSVHCVPIARDELERSVRAFYDKISRRDLNVDEPARKLYDLLLKPAAERLTGRTTLIIVPDGPLWELPFNALKSPSNRFLIEDAAVSYAPSLTALYEMRKLRDRPVREKTFEALAFGDPSQSLPHGKASRRGKLISKSRLPDAKQETKTIANLFRPRGCALIGERANENSFRKLSGAARILHIASHGIVDNISPMYSCVTLAADDVNPDGRLEAWEIADMNIDADLVTLSACDTAGGKFSQGEGMIGLSWAFFIAGCRSTLVSQWKVESQATAELMIEFYRRYSRRTGDARISKTEALRGASLKMLKRRQYAHPFYWAGFALIGDER
jgi:CHAT domain-containing protein